jgi:hypothetical protein
MRTPVFPGTKILTVLGLSLCSLGVLGQCKNIDAEAKVTPAQEPTSRAITIELKNARSSEFTISLFGPDKKNELNANKTTFDNLAPGKYLIVIVGRREEDNYCPKSINITVN